MARGRMLNKSVSASLKFHALPDDTCRLLASWTISHLDFNGVFFGDPVMVKSYVFPRRADVTVDMIEGYLQAMEKAELIHRFTAKGDTWQHWPGFADNQIGLRAERETTPYPPPPDSETEPMPTEATESPQDDGTLPEEIPQDAGEMSAEEKVSQGLKEIKEKESSAATASPPTPPPKPKPRAKKLKTPTPLAVQAFRECAHRFPAKSWFDKVAAAVGEAETDLAFWREIVTAWVGLGWNPTNVKGMLELYQKREIPGNSKGRRRVPEPVGLDAMREIAIEEGWMNGDT